MNLQTAIKASLLTHVRRNIDRQATSIEYCIPSQINIGKQCSCHEDWVPVVSVKYLTTQFPGVVQTWQFPGGLEDLMERVELVA